MTPSENTIRELEQLAGVQNPQQRLPLPGETFLSDGGSAILIPLFRRKGFSGQFAKIDASDANICSAHKWYAGGKKTIYAVRYYRTDSEKFVTLLMHQAIMGMPPVGFEWDHRDLDKMNNRRGNLRLVTRAQNCANRVTYSKLGFKGVYKKTKNTWGAHLTVDSKSISLGSFRTIEEAAAAYDRKAREVWGEFARLNFE